MTCSPNHLPSGNPTTVLLGRCSGIGASTLACVTGRKAYGRNPASLSRRLSSSRRVYLGGAFAGLAHLSPALPGKGHATKYFSDYSPRHDANRDKAIFLRVVARLHALSIGDTAWNGRGKQIAEQLRQ